TPKVASTGKLKRGGTGKLKKPKLPVPPAIKDVFDALRATSLTGHIDFFVQFIAESKSDGAPQFTLIGGAKVADGGKLAGGLTEILRQVQANAKITQRLDLNVDSHAGVTFHRLVETAENRGPELMYGGQPAVYVGLGSQAVWFAIGQPSALAQLKQVIDRAQDDPESRPSASDRIPFQITMHMKRWIEFGQANGEELQRAAIQQQENALAAQRAAAEANGAKEPASPETPKESKPNATDKPANSGNNQLRNYGNGPGGNRGGERNRPSPEQRWEEMQRQAFSGNDDLLRVDFKPTDQGARLKLTFDESFIRLMGLGISAGIDSQNEQRRRTKPGGI
ncbi:MAG TPA: hypothetical protein VK137_07565, partial [Planctomycetaceae bacterium]|nr:hypothetical protein [Planctomycetaceae bacterium]